MCTCPHSFLNDEQYQWLRRHKHSPLCLFTKIFNKPISQFTNQASICRADCLFGFHGEVFMYINTYKQMYIHTNIHNYFIIIFVPNEAAKANKNN